ncbi:hypothetical protein [Chitinophaga vietnamensis]|uniref:hypothetical protein n=1 Tax=Chitinophaga vietnamensis TaxID=2593957 RepID=UPI0011779707|nr:hypothetical protein [Chitinophaga vietnamensis]
MKAVHSNHPGILCAFLLLDLLAVPLSATILALYHNSLMDSASDLRSTINISPAFGAGVLLATCAFLNLLLWLPLRVGRTK